MQRDNLHNIQNRQSTLESTLDKKQLRRHLLKQRQEMDVIEWKQKSDRITTHLQTSRLFQQAKTILAFFSFRQEPDLSALFSNSEKRWGFPRCVDNSLMWHFWQPEDSLNIGSYGIYEPHPHAEVINIKEVDLLLIPCVGCDLQRYRLGYGGGYYDRFLSSTLWQEQRRETVIMGIVFDFAYLPQLPRDHWDQPLHGVVCENGVNI